MFTGISTLRKAEKKESSAQNKALQDYLKRYADTPGGDDGTQKKRKKRKKPVSASGMAIMDGDVTGFEGLAVDGGGATAAGARQQQLLNAGASEDGDEGALIPE